MRLRYTIASLVIGMAVALLIRVVGLLDCGCANVDGWDYIIVAAFIVGGFAVMLPDKER